VAARPLLALALAGLLAASCGLLRPRPVRHRPYDTPSGLRVRDAVIPEGEVAEPGDWVAIHYTGRLADGTEFDSSLDRGVPAVFQLGSGAVPAGLDEGVTGMHRRGKRRIVVPPELGFGADGAPPRVPPHSVLHFEIELLALGDDRGAVETALEAGIEAAAHRP